MQIDIRTTNLQPLRHTFAHVARRLGSDKPASRYQEATFDLQPTTSFHYRPLWDPERDLYDERRTAIQMADWYIFKDPRQFYYGSWTIARAKQQDSVERNFAFVEKRNLLDLMTPEWKQKVQEALVPLRHLEYSANLNNCFITAYGYGAAVTQATMLASMDRLGIAQYLTRIGLILDGNTGAVLDVGKQAWLNDPMWQPLRELAEELLTLQDWFELLVAQNFVLDGLLYPLVYERFDTRISENGGSALAMLTEFMVDWFAETNRFTDMMLKTAAAESAANKTLLEQWTRRWTARVAGALAPLTEHVFAAEAEAVMRELQDDLRTRAKKKCGLDL